MATPATGAFTGTPASISASDAPQTVAMELEPFDSVISETTRSVYANSSTDGSTASIARRRQPAVADLAALGADHHARLADTIRREVVVQHEAVLVGALERVDHRRVAQRAQRGDNEPGSRRG
jgi:hypothetical protein